MPTRAPFRLSILLAGLSIATAPAHGQWTNHYPKLAGYSHHVYVEGYELPIINAGITDAAASPVDSAWIIAARGWLWRFDPTSGVAERLTNGGGIDSRPAWSPDGSRIAFVRDDGSTLAVIVRDLANGTERTIEQGFALDPSFSADGSTLFYSSASGGDLDLWRIDLASGAKERLTTARGIERRPLAHPDGQRLVYIGKGRGGDQVRVRPIAGGEEQVLVSGSLYAQLSLALSPDGSLAAITTPGHDTWELRLASVDRPGATTLIRTGPGRRPLAPAFTRDGESVLFVEADMAQRTHLSRIATVGGNEQRIRVREWRWGAETGQLVVRTRVVGSTEVVPARLTIADANGHPLVPEAGQPRFDGQTGTTYFYSDGTVAITAPAGEVAVTAVRGLTTPPVAVSAQVRAGRTDTVTLDLREVWNARQASWYSGDHHFHLNYGGMYALTPPDLLPLMRGENLDVATPLLANLHNRFEDQAFWGWSTPGNSLPAIHFGQEVRPHFLGHTALVGIDSLFWPWVWGPGYEVYGRDDRPNAAPLDYARARNAIGTYVHPVSRRGDPFANDTTLGAIPVAFVADAVLGHVAGLEVLCLWSDELATSEVWYRLLNIGVPIAPTAGTDVMTDFHRTMGVGTTRAYVYLPNGYSFDRYLQALRSGHSMVTNGPILEFTVGDSRPGDTLPSSRSARWALALHSAVPVERVEILVNGRVVWSDVGVDSAGTKRYSGSVPLPQGGWVAARALGPATERWPAMDSYAFAHTAPVWIGSVGSTEAKAKRAAAEDLLRALDVATRRLETGYAGSEIPRLRAHFAAARDSLTSHAGR